MSNPTPSKPPAEQQPEIQIETRTPLLDVVHLQTYIAGGMKRMGLDPAKVNAVVKKLQAATLDEELLPVCIAVLTLMSQTTQLAERVCAKQGISLATDIFTFKEGYLEVTGARHTLCHGMERFHAMAHAAFEFIETEPQHPEVQKLLGAANVAGEMLVSLLETLCPTVALRCLVVGAMVNLTANDMLPQELAEQERKEKEEPAHAKYKH